MEISTRDRYRGAMVGTLAGDAMGAPVEWQGPEYVADYFAKIGGYHLHDYLDPWAQRRGKTPTTVLAGQPTDDSELAAALAQSLVAHPEFKAGDLYNRLRSFIHGRKAILSDRAYGQGGTLKAALESATYTESVAKFAAGEIPTPPSNGSLMRSAPVALLAYPHVAWTMKIAQYQSMVTHQNIESVAACVAYSVMMNGVLGGHSPEDAWQTTRAELNAFILHRGSAKGVDIVRDIKLSAPNYETEMKDKEGWAVLSLRVALWASISAENFADGIVKAISVGGDTDTYGAVAGGLLGAYYGIQGIPGEWQIELLGRGKMVDLADSLYDIAHPS